MNKQDLGHWGEGKAAQYLIKKGIEIIAHNQRNSYGELDIIGKDGEQIVFFEVKTRTSDSFGYGEDSITNQKQTHLVNSAEAYLQEHTELGEDWRIDLISIDGSPRSRKVTIRWFKNAIPGS